MFWIFWSIFLNAQQLLCVSGAGQTKWLQRPLAKFFYPSTQVRGCDLANILLIMRHLLVFWDTLKIWKVHRTKNSDIGRILTVWTVLQVLCQLISLGAGARAAQAGAQARNMQLGFGNLCNAYYFTEGFVSHITFFAFISYQGYFNNRILHREKIWCKGATPSRNLFLT